MKEAIKRTLSDDTTKSVEEQCKSWQTEITKILGNHMPIKKMRVREKDAPYITREWKEAIRQNKYAKGYKILQIEESREEMKDWRNNATHQRRKSIRSYY